MPAKILSGKDPAAATLSWVKCMVSNLADKYKPRLDIIQVGDDPASSTYVRNKVKDGEKCGIIVNVHTFDGTGYHKAEIIQLIKHLSQYNPGGGNTAGIIVQLPLPEQYSEFDVSEIINTIKPELDVDGLTDVTIAKLERGYESRVPCTPGGIIKLLKYYGLEDPDTEYEGKNVVIVNRSHIVGKPLAQLMLNRNATVTICHSYTRDLNIITSKADILITATGVPGLITKESVKLGAIVVDVGTTYGEDGKLHGDCDFDSVSDVADYITPVPGGVGLMTRAMLMENVFMSSLQANKIVADHKKVSLRHMDKLIRASITAISTQ